MARKKPNPIVKFIDGVLDSEKDMNRIGIERGDSPYDFRLSARAVLVELMRIAEERG